jgi:hypothetical protein
MTMILPFIGGIIGVLIVACLLYCVEENKAINRKDSDESNY